MLPTLRSAACSLVLLAAVIPACGQGVLLEIFSPSGTLVDSVRVQADSISTSTQAILNAWRAEGFIAASQDSIATISPEHYQAYLYKGMQFTWGQYQWSEDAGKFGLGRQPRPGDILNPEILTRDVTRVLQTLDANGYPFARIQSSSSIDTSGQVSIELKPTSGPLVLVDSVILRSNSLSNAALIARTLGLRKGRPYDGRQLRNAPLVLNGTGYLTASREPQPLFAEQGAIVFCYAERRKASSANGILGFQPAPDGSITFTGQADLVLRNMLERGEGFEMHWRRLQAATQEFELGVSWPYILGSTIGIRSELELYRQDTTFANLFFRNAITFPLTYLAEASAFVEVRRSSSLEESFQDTLSNLAAQMYGLGLKSNVTDNPFNPTRGLVADLSVSFGRKTVPGPEGLPDRTLNQFNSRVDVSAFIRLRPRWVFAPRFQLGWMEAEGGELYFNELFLLGGLNSFRGFDEGILRPSRYLALNTEIRFLLDDNSHLLILGDIGAYSQEIVGSSVGDDPAALGAGIRFATGNGQFQLIYALGRLASTPFQFATGKVHFGFVSYF